MSEILPTVAIVNIVGERKIINERDYDPKKHVLWDEREVAAKPAKGAKAKADAAAAKAAAEAEAKAEGEGGDGAEGDDDEVFDPQSEADIDAATDVQLHDFLASRGQPARKNTGSDALKARAKALINS